ncbi:MULTISPECIES: hypothetical protein [Cyanophyceae]|uniref:hypothetical protein n=1 Tax=Cyanophyceae TaxID=3028117 RepID=UPI0016864C1A|nr:MULTISPECIES: hypothetical protein [Cyanophyceae]MBD1918903.1 hypothetical protein [Phormidium sp. FACHB-77]MBD2033255.1 hypothetical protein [Phormidium sp. FACHB-322]MBD2053812.1 hypothetical protein [Leptolyngbya sp. FACHB-60]
MADPKNIANPSSETSNIGYMADRSVPNWGKSHPLPELEAVIAELSQLRAEANHGDRQWEQARTAAYRKAGRLLKVKPARTGSGSSRWNPTIDDLDHYRDDWRGEVVPVRRVEVA